MRHTDSLDSKIFAAFVIALVFIFYGLIALRRKAKLRSLAGELGATYVDTGRFAPGKLVGSDFSLDVHTVGVGRSRRYCTTVRVSAPKMDGNYLLRAPFFEKYPDWRFAKVLGTVNERVFVTNIRIPRYLDLSREQRDILCSSLKRASSNSEQIHRTLRKNRIKEVLRSDGSVTTTFRGVVSDLSRLRESLSVLRLIT